VPTAGVEGLRRSDTNRRVHFEATSRELCTNTAGILRRVESGDEFVITTRGRRIAALVPLSNQRRRWPPRAELIQRLGTAQADSGLRADLARVGGGTTDDFDPTG
jgi:prevent-host-death family protein